MVIVKTQRTWSLSSVILLVTSALSEEENDSTVELYMNMSNGGAQVLQR